MRNWATHAALFAVKHAKPVIENVSKRQLAILTQPLHAIPSDFNTESKNTTRIKSIIQHIMTKPHIDPIL